MIFAEVAIDTLEDEVELGTALAQTWITSHRIEVSCALPSLLLIIHVFQLLAQLRVAIETRLLAGAIP